MSIKTRTAVVKRTYTSFYPMPIAGVVNIIYIYFIYPQYAPSCVRFLSH